MDEQLSTRAQNTLAALANVTVRLKTVFALFDDPAVTEVNITGPSQVFMVRNAKRERVDASKLNLTENLLVVTLNEIASSAGSEAYSDKSSAAVRGRMPGYRFTGMLSPVSANGTSLNIRKHNPRVLNLSDYVSSGQLPQVMADYLSKAIKAGKNILISGSTDSGKTTFLNALSREIPFDVRVVSIEDTRELSLTVDDWTPLEYNGRDGVDPTMCIQWTMRASPDRIILGELKDSVAAEFLEAMNTGHEGGMATTHANSPIDALARVEILTMRSSVAWPLAAIRQQINSCIHIVVQLKKEDGQRRITEIIEIDPTGEPAPRMNYAYRTVFGGA